jgi:acyl phosphate:glycerol-3-phosphate acyltransferase
VWISKYVSLGSILASLALPPLAYVAGSPPSAVVVACAASAIVLFRHRSNLSRLRGGTERRLGAREAAAPPAGGRESSVDASGGPTPR